MTLHYINNSRMKRFDKCRRLAFWNDYFEGVGLQPKGSEPEYLTTGKSVHHGLAVHYTGATSATSESQRKRLEAQGFVGDPAGAGRLMYYEERGIDEYTSTEEEDADAAYVHKLVSAYLAREKPIDDFQVKAVEDSFHAALGEVCWKCGSPYPKDTNDTHCRAQGCNAPIFYLVGRLDLVVEREGSTQIIDHKTAKSLSEDYENSFAYDFQLLGYVYGYSKAKDVEIKKYGINWLQKAKTVGEPNSQLKNCPVCNNRTKKEPTKYTCTNCNQTGKVEREQPLDPFRRKYFDVTEPDLVRYQLYANRILREMNDEKALFEREPDVAYRMDDRSCSYCPFRSLCWDNDNPQRWWNKTSGDLDKFQPRDADYVDLIREEMQ